MESWRSQLSAARSDLPERNKRAFKRERRLWDDVEAQPMALGCSECADLPTCGGLHKKQNAFSCLDDCCGGAANCDSVCPTNVRSFRTRLREIDGFDLSNVPRATPQVRKTSLPIYVPMIYHANRRSKLLDVEAAAIPLHKLYRRRDGELVFRSRREIALHFGINPNAQMLAVGSGRDKSLEVWWGLGQRRRDLARQLSELGLDLVTAPNFSLFTDQPRYDDLYNIKRIAIAWQELAANMPAALHTNARTERDYERFSAFINERDEVLDLSFEFATGAKWPGRQSFHRRMLANVAQRSERGLRLTMIGGIASIRSLALAFERLVYVDTTAFMTSLNRQELSEGNDLRLRRSTRNTPTGDPVDDLLDANVGVMRRRVLRLASDARQPAVASSAQQPRILGSTASEQVETI